MQGNLAYLYTAMVNISKILEIDKKSEQERDGADN